MLDLGNAIRIVRTAQQKTVREVAKKAGIGSPFLSLLERGKRQPSLETLRRIADALSVPSEALILLAVPTTGHLRTDNAVVSGLADALRRVVEAEAALKKKLKSVK